jgi:hypothetical protein
LSGSSIDSDTSFRRFAAPSKTARHWPASSPHRLNLTSVRVPRLRPSTSAIARTASRQGSSVPSYRLTCVIDEDDDDDGFAAIIIARR